jgi:flagellar motor switch/type III secretory pathway protein FliN
MTVAAFDLGGCPKVAREEARSIRAALGGVGAMTPRRPLALPPFGEGALTFIGFGAGPRAGRSADSDGEASSTIELALGQAASSPTAAGWLIVDLAFAARLVDVALGGRGAFSTARRLGPAERGVLAGILGAAFDHLGWAVALAPPPSRSADARGLIALVFRLETPAVTGDLRVAVTPSTLSAFARGEADLARAGRLPIAARLTLAATELGAPAVVGLAAGDAIVFDGVRADRLGVDGRWPGHLVVGDYAAPVTVDADGRVAVDGGYFAINKEDEHMSASGSNVGGTTVVNAAPVEVVAEIGRITLRGDEVLGLAPGAVLALGADRRRIAVRVGGELWADGELVDIDGELGVRVTRLLPR